MENLQKCHLLFENFLIFKYESDKVTLLYKYKFSEKDEVVKWENLIRMTLII